MKGVQDELNVELGRVDLPNRWRALLVRAGFVSCAEVLLLAPFALAKRTGLSERDVFDLLHVVSEGALVACGSTASPVASASQNRLSTGDDGIDRLLGGGLHIGSLTELAGQPSVSYAWNDLGLRSKKSRTGHRASRTLDFNAA